MTYQHPGIDQFPVEIDDDPRPHWNITADFLAANPELEAHRVTPSLMRRVFAGDDPADPLWTVALRFPDADAEAFALGAWWVEGLT